MVRSDEGGNRNQSNCVVVALRFMILIQLMNTILCFTFNTKLPPVILRHASIHRPPHVHLLTPSDSGWRIPPMTKSTTVSTLSTVSTTAASLDDGTTSNKKQQMFRLPTINRIENNRIHRRMESTYKDHSYWVKHRSNDRLLHHIRTMPRSIIYQTIRRPVRYITYISTFVVLWNCLVLLSKATTATFDMPHQVTFLFSVLSKKLLLLRIPIDPLVVTSPMLGLLLVFRTNSCYKRYEEALINWTKTKNQSRNIIRMAKSMRTMSSVITVPHHPILQPHHVNVPVVTQLEQQQLHSEVVHLGLCLWVFARTMKRQLSHADDDEIGYRNEIYNASQLPQLYRQQLLLQVRHRPNYALQYLSDAIENLSCIPNIRKNEIHAAVTTFEQCLGSNERILSSPVPLSYTRVTSRFLFLWLAFCPFALYTDVINKTAFIATIGTMSSLSIALVFIRSLFLIPMMYVISMFLFGIDEIAMQCEEPFSILPQQNYCDEIYNDCIEIANFDDIETSTTAATTTTMTIDDTINPNPNTNDNDNYVATGNGNISPSAIESVPTSQHQHHYTNKADQYVVGHS